MARKWHPAACSQSRLLGRRITPAAPARAHAGTQDVVYGLGQTGAPSFNSGAMLVRPSLARFVRLVSALSLTRVRFNGEQDFLNEAFAFDQTARLPFSVVANPGAV